MKKALSLSLLLFITISILAQEDTSLTVVPQSGDEYYQSKGDWVLGIDANPFLGYLGNLLITSESGNESPSFTFTAQRPGQIFGKYYFKDFKAIRVGLRIGITSFTEKDGNPIDPSEIDELKTSAASLGVSIGVENYKKLKRKLNGYWGYEIGFDKTPYSGLNYDGLKVVEGKIEFIDPVTPEASFKEYGGNTVDYFGRGLVGIQYFFAPKISLSGEFGLGIGYQNTSKRIYKIDEEDGIVYDAGSSGLYIKNTASGAIVLLFHF